jgi:tetratricopeptide (TPR) repeat protein/O-antigen ligase
VSSEYGQQAFAALKRYSLRPRKSRVDTKLSSFCEALMEAAWLACLIVTPLLFNVQSSSVFEPDKAVVVRSLALVMVLAGLLRFAEKPFAPLRDGPPGRASSSLGSRSWAIVALLYLSAQALSTATSVAPHVSFWGSYTRLQGLYTTAAYVVVFLTVLTFCRRQSQVERVIQACLLTSLPVSLYGIIQSFGTDPVSWSGNVVVRPGSTMGNPIFLAAFLIMVVPLTLYRYVEVGRVVTRGQTSLIKWVFVGGGIVNIAFQLVAWSRGPVSGSLAALVTLGLWAAQGHVFSAPLAPFVRTGAYSVLLSAQLAAILLSRSRGPLLALLIGLSAFIALWALTRGKWRWLGATAAVVATVAATLILLNYTGSPLHGLQPLPQSTVGRFARILEGSGRVRLLLWEGAVGVAREDATRFVWGHGPESGQLTLPRHVPAELGRRHEEKPDRSHNETFDVLVTTGLLGLAAYVALFTGMLVRGIRWAGAASTRAERRLAAAACLAGACGGVLLARAIDGSWRFSGLALPAGMLAGVLICLAVLEMRHRAPRHRWSNRRIQAVLLFSALVAHFVEIQVGIAITATRVYFWVFLALMAGTLGGLQRPELQQPAGARRRAGAASTARLVVPGLMLTLALLTVVFDFVPARASATVTVLWLAGCTWLLAAVMSWSESVERSPQPDLKKHLMVYVGLPLVAGAVFAACHRLPAALVADPTLTPFPFYLALLILVVTTGLCLAWGRRLPALAGSGHGVFGAPAGVRAGALIVVLGVLTAVVIVTTNLDAVRADISLKQAQSLFARPGQADEAERWAERAVAILPSRDHLHSVLGQVRQRRAEIAAASEQQERIFAQAEHSLLTAHELSPLQAENSRSLARLYRSWAERLGNGEDGRALLGRAASSYSNALDRDPTDFRTWNELAEVHMLAGDVARAEAVLEHSLALNDAFSGTYVEQGRLRLAQGDLHGALVLFQRALSLNEGSAEALRGLGLAYAGLGRAPEAARAYEYLLALTPADLDAHLRLANIYALLGRPDLAEAHAQTALELAPPGQRNDVEQRVREILVRRRPAADGRN